jgi:hypothetical protein
LHFCGPQRIDAVQLPIAAAVIPQFPVSMGDGIDPLTAMQISRSLISPTARKLGRDGNLVARQSDTDSCAGFHTNSSV